MSCSVVWNTISSASRRVLPSLTPSAVAAAASRMASTRATMSRPSKWGAQRTARPYRPHLAFGTVPLLMASRDGGDDARRQLAVVLLALFLLLVQFPVVVTTLTHGGPQAFDYQFPVFPSDIVLVPLIVLAAPEIVRRIRART